MCIRDSSTASTSHRVSLGAIECTTELFFCIKEFNRFIILVFCSYFRLRFNRKYFSLFSSKYTSVLLFNFMFLTNKFVLLFILFKWFSAVENSVLVWTSNNLFVILCWSFCIFIWFRQSFHFRWPLFLEFHKFNGNCASFAHPCAIRGWKCWKHCFSPIKQTSNDTRKVDLDLISGYFKIKHKAGARIK